MAIFFTCTDLIKENIIHYCGTWYESDRGGFAAMFVDPYLFTHMTMNLMMKRLMKITLKNHVLLICMG
jgi:hypothetical protein